MKRQAQTLPRNNPQSFVLLSKSFITFVNCFPTIDLPMMKNIHILYNGM